MTTRITTRWIFAVFQVVFGLVAPAIFATGFFTKSSLATVSFHQLAYWLGIPAVCFTGLALASLIHRANQFRVSWSGIWGAAIAGYLAFVMPATLLWLTTGENYRGGGANIGVALLVYALPLYLPFAMVAGFGFGRSLRGQKKHT